MEALIDDTNMIYGKKDVTVSTNDVRFRFYFDPNSISSTGWSRVYLDDLIVNSGPPWFVCRVSLVQLAGGGQYKIGLEAFNDDNTSSYDTVNISDQEYLIEVYAEKGADGAGQVRLWLDGDLKITHGSLDSDALWANIDHFLLGVAYTADGDFSGTIYLDEFKANDDGSVIGSIPDVPIIDNFVDGSWGTDNTPTLQFDLSDPDSNDTVHYQLQIDDNSDFSSAVVDVTEGSGDTEPRSNVQYTPSALDDGSGYYWRVKAIDDGGNESPWATANSGSVAFKVDATAPASFTPTANPSSWNSDTTPTISFSTTDAGSGIDHYEVKIGSGGTYTAQSSPYTLLAQSDGEQTIYVKAVDTAGNETEANVNIYVDATVPSSFDLDGPGGNAYSTADRPSFRWKAASTPDATSGLNKYKLEIEIGDTAGDAKTEKITIDDIPTSGTADAASSRYVIHYQNFDDGDSGNNYISVNLKSSSEWGENENDGKLKEGKISWKVTAYDNAGNERGEGRVLFVDRTGPEVEVTQINDSAGRHMGLPLHSGDHEGSPLRYSTTDTTPTVYGEITDSLHEGDSIATLQNDNRVASGPKEVEIKIEKENYFGDYELYSLSTINLTESFWADKGDTVNQGDRVEDNAQNHAGKYSPFEYTPSTELPLGNYRIALIGKDKAGNETVGAQRAAPVYLTIKSFKQFLRTPEVKGIIEELEKETGLPRKEVEKMIEEQGIVISEELKEPSKIIEGLRKLIGGVVNIYWKAVETTKVIANAGIKVAGQIAQSVGNAGKKTVDILAYSWGRYSQFVRETQQKTLAFVLEKAGQSIAFAGEKVGKALSDGYNQVANNAPGAAKTILTGAANVASNIRDELSVNSSKAISHSVKIAASATGNGFLAMTNNIKQEVGNIVNKTTSKTTSTLTKTITTVGDGVGKFAENTKLWLAVSSEIYFDKEPTKIVEVKVLEVGETHAVVSWRTNHHTKNNKVNFGEDRSYGNSAFAPDREKEHTVKITDLKPNTKYFFEAMSQNKNYIYDARHEFRTLGE